MNSITRILIPILTIALVGCTSPPESGTTAKNAASTGNSASGAQASPTGGQALADPSPPGIQPENPLAAQRNKKIEAMRRSGGDANAPAADIETVLSQSTRPAPEDSQFSVALTNILVERRTFLKHPVLASVEKVTDGPNRTIKVRTRDGRTIDLPGNAIQSISTAPAAGILRAAGISMPEQPKSDIKKGSPAKN